MPVSSVASLSTLGCATFYIFGVGNFQNIVPGKPNVNHLTIEVLRLNIIAFFMVPRTITDHFGAHFNLLVAVVIHKVKLVGIFVQILHVLVANFGRFNAFVLKVFQAPCRLMTLFNANVNNRTTTTHNFLAIFKNSVRVPVN